MELTNQQLTNYVGRIKLTQEMKRRYASQIDHLISELESAINEQTTIRVTRVVRAGSWKKGTALRPRSEHPLDVDLVFFLNLEEASTPDTAKLHDYLLGFLLNTYKNKKPEDFSKGEKTVSLVFRGTGLHVDLVPVAPLKRNSAYVWQPSSSPSPSLFVTSVDGQLDFITGRKTANSTFSSTVRILKAWRARQELDISSFAIELLASHLDISRNVETNVERALVRFFEFLSRRQKLVVTFPGAVGAISDTHAVAYLADPTYTPNNILSRISAASWEEVRTEAEKAWETIELARAKQGKGETVQLWKEIFGPYFNIEPIEPGEQ
jgi:hypothetical protein